MPDRLELEVDVWREIERAARQHALTVLEADEKAPPVLGARIAWVDGIYGRTDALSPIHRVGYPVGDKPYTTCHEAIPAPIRWMILSPALLRTMDLCRFCEVEHQRAGRSHAA